MRIEELDWRYGGHAVVHGSFVEAAPLGEEMLGSCFGRAHDGSFVYPSRMSVCVECRIEYDGNIQCARISIFELPVNVGQL